MPPIDLEGGTNRCVSTKDDDEDDIIDMDDLEDEDIDSDVMIKEVDQAAAANNSTISMPN